MQSKHVTAEMHIEMTVVLAATELSDRYGSDVVDEYIDHVIIEDRTFDTIMEAMAFIEKTDPEEYS